MNEIQLDENNNRETRESFKNNNASTIPAAILLAGLMIAGAVLINGHQMKDLTPTPVNPGAIKSPEITMNPITTEDHRLGDPNAKVIVVEYSDLECPYCKAYEPTMHKVVDTYGPNGGVAWVFRHFPVHSLAPHEAEASECAAEQGGNDIFFKYVDKIFSITKSDNNLDPKLLTQTAADLGLNTETFQSCLDSGKYKEKVNASGEDAVAAGGRGTPYTVLVTQDGHKYPLTNQAGESVGAVSFEDLKGVIDNLLKTVK